MQNYTGMRVADADLPESIGMVDRHLTVDTVAVLWENPFDSETFESIEHLDNLIVIG